MKYITRIMSIFLFISSISTYGAVHQVSPYFSIRSQGENAARELAGWTNHINLYDVGHFYGTGALTTEYTKSFHSLRIAQCLFGKDLLGDHYNCRSIKVSGSGVENRGSKDWLADYFGLPRDYQSTLAFCPRIENFIADFNFYFGLDNWLEGLFFRLHVPVTYTKWNLNFSECINNPGTANHQPGYFNGRVTLGNAQLSGSANSYPNVYGVSRSNLVSNFTSYVCDRATPNLGSTRETVMLPDGSQTGLAAVDFPPVFFDPLCKARFVNGACDDISKVGVADLQMALGWNAFQDEDYHVGFGIRLSAPTGNAPEGNTLFEPIIGNGNHWEFGALFTSHATLWKSDDEFQQVGFFFDANVTHLFKTEQVRTFDLKNKPNSRYMIAQKMTSDVGNLVGSTTAGIPPSTTTTPSAQFANQFTPIANLSTLCVDVSVGVQADMVFMLAYQRGNFVWDLGYNLWVRSCENIELDCKCPTPFTSGKTWVLKGDGQVYGYAQPNANGSLPPGGQPLSASQSAATIHGGTNGYISLDTTMGGVGGLRPTRNPGVDASQFALNTDNTQIYIDNPNVNPIASGQAIVGEQIKTSVNPIFIRDCDLDIDGARTKGLSHKVFTHISYTWVEYQTHWDPYLGVGAEGEFHPISKDCEIDCRKSPVLDDPCDKSCQRCGLSQWGVWVKGGVSFD